MKLMFLTFSAILLLASCGGEEEAPAEVANAPSFPLDTLEITGYIGEELGDSTSTFGILADAEYHRNTGNILILDSGAACFKEYTPSGEYIRQVSRQGSGPGELSFATLEFFQIGGNVLALNRMKQGFVVFDDSLKYLEEISLWSQNQPMQNAALSDSTFASFMIDFTQVDNGNLKIFRRIVLFTYNTEEYDHIFWEDSVDVTISDLVGSSSWLINDLFLGTSLTADRDVVLFALRESENYTIHGWHPDGTEAFTISIPLEPVAKSDQEIAEEKAYIEGFFAQMGGNDMGGFDPEPYRDMVISVNIGPDGNIWVQRGTIEQPFFDIFDMEGTLIGHKVFPETGWTWRFSMNSMGILAWEDDPELGYQQLFIVQ